MIRVLDIYGKPFPPGQWPGTFEECVQKAKQLEIAWVSAVVEIDETGEIIRRKKIE